MRPAILALADESGHAKQRSSGDSVSAQHQRLDGKQQGLDAQQHRMHEADGVDGMQHKKPLNAPVFFAAIRSWLLV